MSIFLHDTNVNYIVWDSLQVVEKLVDIVIFLHKQVTEAFCNSGACVNLQYMILR